MAFPTGEPKTLTRMLGRPFGHTEEGQPIDHGSGRLIIGAINCLKLLIAERLTDEAGDNLPPAQLNKQIAAAQDEALDQLVAMLNEAITDPRYRVTRSYLLNQSNQYSYEFRLFVSEYCRILSGDPKFYRHAGENSIPPAVGLLGKPLGVQRTFALLPKFTAKVIKTDLRVISTGPTSAVIQWHGAEQAKLVPEPHREAYIRFACQIYQGAYSALPRVVFGLPDAGVREMRCQADGADCCEWQFTWAASKSSEGRKLLLAGGVASIALAAGVFAGLPGLPVLAVAGAAVPVGAAWHRLKSRQLGAARDNLRGELLEERDLAEQEYDRSEEANATLQRTNVELSQRFRELTVLHETALALSSTLKTEEILDASLGAIVGQLGYERAMVLLADDERALLGRGMSVGAAPEMETLIAGLEVPYHALTSPLVVGFTADEPKLFEHADETSEPAVRDFIRAIGTSQFLVTPLVTKGRRVGVLAVDNAITGRPIDPDAGSLLMTLGRQMAGAIEMSNLHARLEAHNRTLEERVTLRTAELQQAKSELEQELEERRRLRERELEYLAEVQKVVAAAIAVEDESFDAATLATTALRGDELGQLARTFTRMAGIMAERENRLLKEVQELRIEIDGNRTARQVADIVSTEYFQSLRSQASDLRRMVSRG